MQKVYNAHLSLKARRQQQKKSDIGLFAEKFSTSPKKNGAGIKYENKEKENNSTHDVLRYV